MRVIAAIEDPDVIKKILTHLDLWEIRRKPRPVANSQAVRHMREIPGTKADRSLVLSGI